MTKRLLNKNIDIYSYPTALEENLGSLALGDLHGNPIKLIQFLFRHKIIKFKQGITNFEESYQEFVSIYEQYGDIVQEYLETRTLLQFTDVKIENTEQRILIVNKELLLDQSKAPSLLLLKEQLEPNLQIAKVNKASLQQKLEELKNKLSPYVDQFNQFMAKLEINDTQTTIRLIGDEVADRGNCDYFTLRILSLLVQNQVPVYLLTSNHGCEFIHAYEKLMIGERFKPKGDIRSIQIKSFWGLQLLLEQGIMSQEELINIIDIIYKPILKIIDYSLSEEGITLYSHAPIRFDSIRLVATYLGVPYEDSTQEALATTIDLINTRFQIYIKNNTSHLLFKNHGINDVTNTTEKERAEWPLVYLIWNRWDDSKETQDARPEWHNGYTLAYVHGHDSFQSKLLHIYNLDTLCGKGSRKNEEDQVNQAFQFLAENRYNNADKTASEDILRNTLRCKVLDCDELTLTSACKRRRASDNFCNAKINNGLRQLSLFGASNTIPLVLNNEQDCSLVH